MADLSKLFENKLFASLLSGGGAALQRGDPLSAGLDPITAAELDRLIIRLSRTMGITFVVVTHELESISAIADRAIVLDTETKGIIAEGTPDYLKNECKINFVHRFFNREMAV